MRLEALIVAQPVCEQWEQLPRAAKAARELADCLIKSGYLADCLIKSGYIVARTDLLDGSDKQSAEQALADWFRNVPEDAHLIFYWSGHCTSDGGHYLVCRDSPRSGLNPINAIDADDLAILIANCKAEKILVILDTCCSGREAAGITSSFARPFASRLEFPGQERAIVVIASAQPYETAGKAGFCEAVCSVLFDPKAPRLWSHLDQFIHPELLARAVSKLLSPDAIQFAAFGTASDFVLNPLYRPR